MVKKKVLLGAVLVLTLLCAALAVAEMQKNNVNIKKVYGPGSVLEGTFNLTLSKYPADSLITFKINKTQQIGIVEFLKKNNVTFKCDPANCMSYYSLGSSGSTKTVNGQGYLAFSATGDNIQIVGLKFDMVGQNIRPECGKTPLMVDLLDDNYIDWKYLAAGEGFCDEFRPSDYYSIDSATYQSTIVPKPYCEKINLPIASKFKLAADIKKGSADVAIKLSLGDAECELANLSDEGLQSCEVEFIAIEEKEYAVCIKAEENDLNDPSDYKIKSEKIAPNCGFWGNISECYDSTIDYGLYAQAADFANFTTVETIDKDNFYGPKDLVAYMQSYIDMAYNRTCPPSNPCIIPLKISSTQDIIFSNLHFIYDSSGGRTDETNFYIASKNSALIDMNSTLLNIIRAEFLLPELTGAYNFDLKLADSPIDSGKINVEKLSAISLYPLNASASIPTKFYVTSENIIRYFWDFGDGKSAGTNNSFVEHTYMEAGDYVLTVTVTTSKNLNITQGFSVLVSAPKDFVSKMLMQKTSYLNSLQNDLDSLPAWYKIIVVDQIDLAELKKTLAAYQKQFSEGESLIELKMNLDNFIVYTGIKDEDLGQAPLIPIVDLDLLGNAGFSNIPESEEAKTRMINELNSQNAALEIKADGIVKIAESEKEGNNRDLLTLITLELNPSETLNNVYIIIKGISNAKFPENTSMQKIDDNVAFVFEQLSEKQNIVFALPDRIDPASIEVVSASEIVKGMLVSCGNSLCDEGENYKTCPDDCKKPITGKIILAILILLAVSGALYWIWKFYVKIYENKLEAKLFKNKADLYNLTFFITKAFNKGDKEEEIRKKLVSANWGADQTDYALSKIKRERRLVQLNTLMNFITSGLRSGKKEELIKNELKEAGWIEKDINYAYKKSLKRIEKDKKKMIEQQKKAQKKQASQTKGL